MSVAEEEEEEDDDDDKEEEEEALVAAKEEDAQLVRGAGGGAVGLRHGSATGHGSGGSRARTASRPRKCLSGRALVTGALFSAASLKVNGTWGDGAARWLGGRYVELLGGAARDPGGVLALFRASACR